MEHISKNVRNFMLNNANKWGKEQISFICSFVQWYIINTTNQSHKLTRTERNSSKGVQTYIDVGFLAWDGETKWNNKRKKPNKQTNREESSRCRSEGAKGRERGAVPDVVPCYCCACFLLLVSACCPNRSPFPCVRMSPQNRKF